jgi:hypothetical protein
MARALERPVTDLLRALGGAALATAAMVAAVLAARSGLALLPDLFDLVLGIALGAAVFLAVVVLVDRELRGDARGYLRRIMAR